MTDRMNEDTFRVEKQRAINALEDAIRRQTEVYAHAECQDDVDRHEQMFLTSWLGVSCWAGVDSEGIPTSKVVVHLNDYELPAWQILGMLRAAQLETEQAYGASRVTTTED